MKYLVQINKKESEVFDLSDQETVQDLKTKVENKVGIPINSQNLYFKDSKLQNSSVLSTLNIPEGFNLNLEETIVPY